MFLVRSERDMEEGEWKIASFALVVSSAVLVVAVLVANLQSPRVALALLISLIAATLVFALVSADVIRHTHRRERQAQTVFEDREQEFRQMARQHSGNLLGNRPRDGFVLKD